MKRRAFYVFLVIGFLALSVSASIAPERAFDADPIASYAHGTFFWEDGITKPDREYLLAVQKHYILKYQASVGRSDSKEASRIKRVIYDMVADPILANGLYLDWLLQKAGGKRFSREAITANTIRSYYVERIQVRRFPAVVDGYWTKGIERDLFRALQREGLYIFDKVKATNRKAIDECIAAGVPVPDKLFDEHWKSFGILGHLIGGSDPHNELEMYISEEPRGFCISLTRSDGPNDDKGHIDLICMGQESSNACFLEAIGYDNNIQGSVPIADLLVGDNLPIGEPGSAAPCTYCHIGENPIIVHPKDGAFKTALQAKAESFGSSISWSAANYYHPFGVTSWPPNPPPLDLSLISSKKQCSGCHEQSYAGRFPDVAQTPNPMSYQGYCSTVLRGVLGLKGDSPTMPLDDIPDTASYAAHKNFLLAMCNKPDEGVLVDNTFEDDPSFLSPPQVNPPYACAEAVNVVNFVDESKVELVINDAVVAITGPARVPGPIEFSLSTPLKVGDRVQARQTANGATSALSNARTAVDYKDHFPDGLPAPTIDPSTIYRCSSVMAVRYDISGFPLKVLVNGGNAIEAHTFSGHKQIKPGKTPFELGDEFTAQVSACEDVSPLSDAVKAKRLSSDMLTEAQINPVFFYESQNLINIGNLTYGSSSEILKSSGEQTGKFSTPLSWKIARLSQPLALSDQLVVSQQLCGFSSQPPFATSPSVLTCSSLPAPKITDPLPGQDFVRVEDPMLGARVRIYDQSGNELGDGTGSMIPLKRTLIDGEFIIGVQQLGTCISNQGFKIEV